jgi:D-inositol-3-phosphate glycosyltransferase
VLKNIIIGPAFPYRGGIANFNEALCRSFIANGTTSEIVSFTLQYPSVLFPGKTQYDTSGNKPEKIVITESINSINPISWIKTANEIVRKNPDYVIFRYWIPFMAPALGSIARLIKRKSNNKIKIIAITDNVIPHEKRLGDKPLTRYFVNSCDAFVAMSGSVVEDLKLFTNKPIEFIPHPIYDIFGNKTPKQTAREKLGIKQDEKTILFFGFIRKYKGLDILLEAMADERLKKLGVKLIIAGEFYDDKNYYDEIINRHGLTHYIALLNSEFIPSEDVKYYFCAADMVVQPYRTATQSGVTQIAYHFERPMLVTNVGGLAEIVPHNIVGYVCDTNAESVSGSIFDFYSNNRETEFEQNIKSEKKRFTWEAMTEGINNLLQKLY